MTEFPRSLSRLQRRVGEGTAALATSSPANIAEPVRE